MKKQGTKNGRAYPKTASGFTLIEMIVAIGVFAIMSVALSGAFASGFSTYRDTRELQRNVETAQYAMNTLEKLLRTSTVKSAASASTPAITFYDYSSSRCFQYRFFSPSLVVGILQARWYPELDVANCDSGGFGSISYADVTSGYVTGSFVIAPSDKDAAATDGDPKAMGRVTVNLSVKTDASAAMESRIQATSSLRDYSYVGF